MSDLHTTLSVAFRHIGDPTTTEQEREAILVSMSLHMGSEESDLASQQLYHLREARRHQLTLRAILDGIGNKGGTSL